MKNLFVIFLSAIVFFSCKSDNSDSDKADKKTDDDIISQKELINTVKYISGKDTVDAYFSLPQGEGPFPALIIIHEQWGLTNWIRTNADVFANKGYAALAINLYRGKSTKNLDEAQQLMQELSSDRINKDLQAALSYLQNNLKIESKRIGIIGWGIGGGFALQMAANQKNLSAIVANYGNLIYDKKIINKISCPVLGIFGETDRGIPLMDVQNFEKTLTDAKKENKIIIYRNVGHAFMNSNNKEGYNPEITERAWREIFTFLEKHLMIK